MRTKIKRHHPITVIYKIYQKIRYSIIPLALFLFNEIRAGTGQQPYWVYFLAVLYGIFSAVGSILSWYKETYCIDENRVLHLTYGVFTITQRAIPLSNINNLSIEQNWVYRLLGIAHVELQTSDSNEVADARLVISQKNASVLSEALSLVEVQSVDIEQRERKMTKKEIFMLSLSSNTFWLGTPVTMTVIQYGWNWFSPAPIEEQVSFTQLFSKEYWYGTTMGDILMLLLCLLAFFAGCAIMSWFFSVGVAQFRYRDWQVIRDENQIQIRHGWIERKSVQIQVDKIQALRVKELIFGRFLGYVSLCLDSVGYSGERRVKLLIPSIHKSEMAKVVRILLPEFELSSPERSLQQNAKWCAVLPFMTLILVSVLIGSIFTLWSIFAVPLLYVIYVYNKYVNYQTKWDAAGKLVVLRKAGINLTTVYLMQKSIESISIKQSGWQRVFKIVTVEFEIDSPANIREYRIKGISRTDYDEILRWYKRGVSLTLKDQETTKNRTYIR